MSSRRSVLGLALAAAIGGAAPGALAGWTAVAVEGDPAPGGGMAETFVSFSAPRVLGDGTVYFLGTTQATRALYRWTAAGGTTRVYPSAVGAPIAGSDPPLAQLAILFDGHLGYQIARDGTLRVLSTVETIGCAVATTALFVGEDGAPLALALQSGETVPALGGGWRLRGRLGTTIFEGVPRRNAAGALAFVAQATADTACPSAPSPPVTQGAFVTDALGGFVVAALADQDAPGFPGQIFDPAFGIDQNEVGQALVATRIRNLATSQLSYAFYRWSEASGLERLVFLGQALPAGGSVQFGTAAHFAEDGAFFFREDRSVAPGGLYEVDASNVVHARHLVGDVAPGLPEGSVLQRIGATLFRSRDAFAFAAWATTPSGVREAIWTVADGGAPLLRFADAGIVGSSDVELVHLAAGGRLVYATGASAAPAYFATDAPGSAEPIAAAGDAFEFAPGDLRPAADLALATDADAARSVVLVTDASGEQGVFVQSAPELPTSLSAIAAIGVLRWLRRRPSS